jgi:hypothetical protein
MSQGARMWSFCPDFFRKLHFVNNCVPSNTKPKWMVVYSLLQIQIEKEYSKMNPGSASNTMI